MAVGRGTHFRVGLFIVVSVGIFLTALALLGVFGSGMKPVRYYIRFPGSVVGLRERGSNVLYRGVPIGIVTDISVDSNNPQWITASADIRPAFHIKKGMSGTIIITDLTGIRHIELTGGTPEEPEISPGETIEGKKNVFEELGNVTQDAIMQSSQFLENVNSLFGNESKGRIESAIRNIERLTSETLELPRKGAGSMKELDKVLQSAHQAGQKLADTLDSMQRLLNDKNLNGAVTEASATAAQLRKLAEELTRQAKSADLGSTVVDARALTKELTLLTRSLNGILGENSSDVRLIVANLRQSSENLRELTRHLSQNPSALVRSSSREDVRPR